MNIHNLGFEQWFEEHAAALHLDGCSFSRVSAVDRGSYLVRDGSREVPAELSGKLAFQLVGAADLPCVGDWVTAQYCNEDSQAIIHRVFPRKSFLRRTAPGGMAGYQMIAANIDTAFIVQSCHFDFNPNRLERYLVMAADGHVEPIVVLTKTDLVSGDDLDRQLALIKSVTSARVISLSNITGTGLAELQQTLAAGRTYCLLGSSGVGKTTLINRLIGREDFVTKAVSGTGEGIHTTTRRQLIVVGSGAMLIDTPGMRELGVAGASEGIAAGFAELAALAAECRYADCRHQREPGCAVRAAIEKGELAEDRLANYFKLKKEATFADMSHYDRRQKDKAFGRLVKSVKKRPKD